jgi:Ca-activated chloride channel family protein
MEGEKMAQAKEAAAYVVGQLNPEDRFNIVSFSTGMRSFAPSLVPVNEAGNYETFINSLEALGGTNISLALLEAMNQADGQQPTTIIFLTDGLATEGITDTGLLVETVQQAAPTNVRLFAFGVGDDVDTTLLDSLAQNHRGTTTYVRPFQAIDEIVSTFYAKVSTPVLADISLDFGGMVVEQLYPQTLPDLFAGSQLVLVGRYRDGGPATITLRGTVNGEAKTFVYEDQFFRLRSGDDFIPRLWATRAIGHLLTEIRLHGENPELVQSVVNLSIRYGIITPYTSYLIEEDDIFT